MLKNIQNYQNFSLIILAEGITEKILLPAFSNIAGLDFNKNGIKVISSGGKNRILRLYNKLSKEVNIPIFMIFDSDGAGLIESNRNTLRDIDDVYVITKGEFEDILPDKLIYRAINDYYRLVGKINLREIVGKNPKAQILADLYKIKGFGDFKKAEFARILSGYIKTEADLSGELKSLFEVLSTKIHSRPVRKLCGQ